MTEPDSAITLLDRLLQRRDNERGSREDAMTVVHLHDAVLEDNVQGRMRWYLHPELTGRCINSTMVYRYEIPPGSCTGLQRHQGSEILYVISGYGRTVLNGVEHSWEKADVIGIPVLPDGAEVQHHNDSGETALLISATPNWIDVFGVDMGSGFEQLSVRPEEGYS